MALYIKPPRGVVSLEKLQSVANRRLDFLLGVAASGGRVVHLKDLVENETTVAASDCLIEGSQKDVLSHFILRLACAQHPDFERFLVSAETSLFRFRFSCMTRSELLSCVKPLQRLLRNATQDEIVAAHYSEILDTAKRLVENRDWETLMDLYINSSKQEYVRLPFTSVLGLVSVRCVHLEGGFARVPCSKLCDVMTSLFTMILEKGLVLARQVLPSVLEDQRLASLLTGLKVSFLKSHGGQYTSHPPAVRAEDIENLTEFYPPCMAHLHRMLRSKHRLRHFSRIQYSLFLKEVGLPVHEALQFWRTEYSLPADEGSCRHHWEKDGKRYTYNIRHLYGLEGARVNYRGHCCTSIQNRCPSPGEEGGCPFVHFDKEHLLHELSLAGLSASSVTTIVKLANEGGRYNEACQQYLAEKLKQHLGMSTGLLDPPSTTKQLTTKQSLKRSPRNDVSLSSYQKSNLAHSCHSGIKRKLESELEFSINPEILTFTQHKQPSVLRHRTAKMFSSQGASPLHCSTTNMNFKLHGLKSPGVVVQLDGCLETKKLSCVDHELCPASQPCDDKLNQQHDITVCKEDVGATLSTIRKPMDYYLSYKMLLDKLKNT